MKIRYDETEEMNQVEYGDSTAYAQQHGKWVGYWAEKPEPGKLADEIRCAECAEEPASCSCEN